MYVRVNPGVTQQQPDALHCATLHCVPQRGAPVTMVFVVDLKVLAGKKKSQSDATAYADLGHSGVNKEENKNFDPRKYREEVGATGGENNKGIEWSETNKEGEKGVQGEKMEGIEWTEKSKL